MPDGVVVWTLARKELGEAVRNRWFLLLAASFAALAVALSKLAMAGVGQGGFGSFDRTGASLVNLVVLAVPLMGLVLGAANLAEEKEGGTLLVLLSQPISPLEILLGKFIGLGLALTAVLALGFGATGALIAGQGAGGAGPFITVVLLSCLLALATLGLGLLVATLAKRSATAMGGALFAWLALTVLGDLGLMGTAVALQLPMPALLASALANPLQSYKVAAVLALNGDLESLGPAGHYAMRAIGPWLPALLASLLVLWAAACLWGAVASLRRRGGV